MSPSSGLSAGGWVRLTHSLLRRRRPGFGVRIPRLFRLPHATSHLSRYGHAGRGERPPMQARRFGPPSRHVAEPGLWRRPASRRSRFSRALVAMPGIAWSRVELFQLDEYVGIPVDPPGEFSTIPARSPRAAGRRRPPSSPRRHRAIPLASSEKPARLSPKRLDRRRLRRNRRKRPSGVQRSARRLHDHRTVSAMVALADAARRQQVNEGWFANLDDVPERAITMSVRQIVTAGGNILRDARSAESTRRPRVLRRTGDAAGTGVHSPTPCHARRSISIPRRHHSSRETGAPIVALTLRRGPQRDTDALKARRGTCGSPGHQTDSERRRALRVVPPEKCRHVERRRVTRRRRPRQSARAVTSIGSRPSTTAPASACARR